MYTINRMEWWSKEKERVFAVSVRSHTFAPRYTHMCRHCSLHMLVYVSSWLRWGSMVRYTLSRFHYSSYFADKDVATCGWSVRRREIRFSLFILFRALLQNLQRKCFTTGLVKYIPTAADQTHVHGNVFSLSLLEAITLSLLFQRRRTYKNAADKIETSFSLKYHTQKEPPS